MVRTKADRVPTKAVASKAPRKLAATPSKKSSGAPKVKGYSGGNPYHPRETPAWQKPITFFLDEGKNNSTDASTSREPENNGATQETEDTQEVDNAEEAEDDTA